jgi:hypothetical protein
MCWSWLGRRRTPIRIRSNPRRRKKRERFDEVEAQSTPPSASKCYSSCDTAAVDCAYTQLALLGELDAIGYQSYGSPVAVHSAPPGTLQVPPSLRHLNSFQVYA